MSTDALSLAESPAARIPLWLKVVYTAFVAVFVPYYWIEYTPANFLWFCDLALFLTLIALWTERPLLASMPAVGILLPQVLWIGDFLVGLVAEGSPVGLSGYMFRTDIPLHVRAFSLFHVWLPLLLVWLVCRLGYDRRAFRTQTLVAWGTLVLTWLTVASPDGPAGNVNKIFGLGDTPQTMMPHAAWLLVLMAVYPLAIYLPTHLALQRLCRPPEPRTARVAVEAAASA